MLLLFCGATSACTHVDIGGGVCWGVLHTTHQAEALMDKGITGNGNGAGVSGFSFTGEGKNLDPSRHNVPRDKARQIALDAAIRRSKTQRT